MPKEIELKVINVDKKEVESRLRELGAKHVATHKFRRVVFETGHGSKIKNLRIRTDGKVCTMTLKERTGPGLDQTYEYEVEVSDFDTAAKILCKYIKSKPIYELNTREEYMLGGVQITIDKWPGIPYYVEIEGLSVAAIKDMYKKLAIKGKLIGNVPHGSVYSTYYNIDYAKVIEKNNKKLGAILGKE
jgi:adenylate cyclase class 2